MPTALFPRIYQTTVSDAEYSREVTGQFDSDRIRIDKIRKTNLKHPQWNTETFFERILCVDRKDNTGKHVIWRGYDAKCSACYLGYSHTEAKHESEVEGK